MNLKTITKIAAVAAVGISTQAAPIFLGTVDDGVAPSVANEVGWVNEILGMTINTTIPSTNPAGETLMRSGNADPGSHSVSTPPAGNIFLQGDPSQIGAGFEYLIAHYGGGGPDGSGDQVSAVFYLGGSAFDVPDNQADLLASLGLSPGDFNIQGRGGYSGFTVYNGETRVPDGGATVALLGLGIAGLGALRRKIS
jgi:hypothetical protein